MDFPVKNQGVENQARLLVMGILDVSASCRHCGTSFSPRSTISFLAGKRVKCQHCGWYGRWRDNTILSRSNVSNLQFFALLCKFGLPDKPKKLAGALGISEPTVREWHKRILAMQK